MERTKVEYVTFMKKIKFFFFSSLTNAKDDNS